MDMFSRRSIALSFIFMASTWAGTVIAQTKAFVPLTSFDKKDPVLPLNMVPAPGEPILRIGQHASLATIDHSYQMSSSLAATTPLCPPDKAGLTDGFQVFTYSLTNDMAASLAFWGKGELSKSDKVILYQFAWYKDVLAADGSTEGRCGAGIMLVLRISNLQGDLSLTLPTLAATAQLGQSAITYRLGTFGLSGAAIDAAIPSASTIGKFDTESYAALLQTITSVQSAYKAGSANFIVKPRPIAVSFPVMVQDADKRVAIQILTMRQIAQGKSCHDAKGSIPSHDQASDNIVADTYASITGSSCGFFSSQPSAEIRAKEAAILKEYGI